MRAIFTWSGSEANEQAIDGYISKKPSVYIYPITPYCYQTGSNNYILKVKELMEEDLVVVNKATNLGIFDILLKLHKCDILYLNWIADLPDRRFGYLQTLVLFFILVACKVFRIKVAWFIHNDISHSRKNVWMKKLIRRMMMVFSDISLSHSNELSIAPKLRNHKVYDHPVEGVAPIEEPPVYSNDVLIWGSVSPYKGVSEFARFNFTNGALNGQKIIVAGKFFSDAFYNEVCRYAKPNIQFINKIHSEEELEELFCQSRYILFCYHSPSVLSSAALCKSIAYGKTVIGPNIGAFKELGKKQLIYTYETFEELAVLLSDLKLSGKQVDKQLLADYNRSTSWEGFRDFLADHLYPSGKNLVLSPVSTSL